MIELKEHNILESRRNLIVSAPTNSGKSLVGLLVLLEPLRALAREKTDELERLAPQLSKVLGAKISVKISTEDYRLDDEFLSSPPPGGEIIVATPERLESLLRNPDNAAWLAPCDVVKVTQRQPPLHKWVIELSDG